MSRLRTRCNNYILCCNGFLFVTFDLDRETLVNSPRKAAVTLKPGDLIFAEQELNAFTHLRDDDVLALEHRSDIHRSALNRNTVGTEMMGYFFILL